MSTEHEPKILGLRAWLIERYESAMAIAARKAGADKAGWLEDAAYFKAAVKALDGRAQAIDEERQRLVLKAQSAADGDWTGHTPKSAALALVAVLKKA